MTPIVPIILVAVALVCALYFSYLLFRLIWKALDIKPRGNKTEDTRTQSKVSPE